MSVMNYWRMKVIMTFILPKVEVGEVILPVSSCATLLPSR